MLRKSPVKPADPPLQSVPAFWPMTMAMTMFEDGAALYAKNLEFLGEEIKCSDGLRPTLATPNQARLDLRTMVLRDYGRPGGIPAKYVSTSKDRIAQNTVPGGHIGLFMGARTLKEHWPQIARWICAQ